MRIRVKMKRNADGIWSVDLPTYSMVPGSFRPVIADLTTEDGVLAAADPADPRLRRASIEVDCPDEYFDEQTGQLDPQNLRRIHKGHPRWNKANTEPPDITPDP